MTHLIRKAFFVGVTIASFAVSSDGLEAQARGRAQSRTVYLCDDNWQNCKEVVKPRSKNYFDLTWIFVLIGGGTWAFRNQQAIKDFMAKHQPPPKVEQVKPTTTKKPTKKLTPLPDPLAKSEWYVRRNGNAEGPYTREQLRDVQHITARTSVKREGQEDWVKAGNVEELANFLAV